MDSTFYKEEGPKFLAEQKVRLQALGMSFHSRLGSMSHLGKIPEEIFQHQLAPYIINGGTSFLNYIQWMESMIQGSLQKALIFEMLMRLILRCYCVLQSLIKAERKLFLVERCCHKVLKGL